jgi:hypothetical protein
MLNSWFVRCKAHSAFLIFHLNLIPQPSSHTHQVLHNHHTQQSIVPELSSVVNRLEVELGLAPMSPLSVVAVGENSALASVLLCADRLLRPKPILF